MRSIKASPNTDMSYHRMLQHDPDQKELIRWRSSAWKNYPDQSKDLFAGFAHGFDYEPNPDPILKSFVDTISETDEFKDIAARTKGNRLTSYSAAKAFGEKFTEMLIDNGTKDQIEASQDPSNPQNKTPTELAKEIEKAKDKIRLQMKKVLKEVDEEVENTERVISALGYSRGPGDPQKVNPEKALSIVQKFGDERFKKLIEFIGRMKNISAKTIQTKTTQHEDELVGVTYGDELEKIHADEFAGNKTMFLLNYVEGSLAMDSFEGKESLGLGDMYVMWDQSSSMRGWRNDECMALLFGMWQIAKKDKRRLFACRFADNAAMKEIKSDEDLMELIELFLGGGTNFDAPLNMMCDELSVPGKKYKKTDAVFITDGMCWTEPKTIQRVNEFKKKIGLKMIGFVLGYNQDAVKPFCDLTYHGSSLFSDEFLSSAFAI